MNQYPRDRVKFLLAILFATAPFVFGLVRRVQTGHDWRLLWMAVASCVGVLIVRAIERGRSAPGSLSASSAVVFIVAALFASVTGFLLGARAGPGTVMVAIVLAICWAVSHALYIRSRSRSA